MKEKSQEKSIRLEDLVPIRNARTKRLSEQEGKRKVVFPPIGTRIKIRFVEDSGIATEALTKGVVEHMRRCGPRSSTRRREAFALSEKDITMLRSISGEMQEWVEASKKNAVLFAADPIEALARMDGKVNSSLLKKLQHLKLRDRPKVLPNTRISSITVETSKKTWEPVGSFKKGTEEEK